jgi:hypothetical protein
MREDQTVDEQFHRRGLRRAALNAAFLGVLRSASLECALFGFAAVTGEPCRVCEPTGVPLYRGDASLDARLPDPCTAHAPKKVAAVRVELVDGRGAPATYFVVDGVRVYEKGAGGHVEVTDARVDAVLEAYARQKEEAGGLAPVAP